MILIFWLGTSGGETSGALIMHILDFYILELPIYVPTYIFCKKKKLTFIINCLHYALVCSTVIAGQTIYD